MTGGRSSFADRVRSSFDGERRELQGASGSDVGRSVFLATWSEFTDSSPKISMPK